MSTLSVHLSFSNTLHIPEQETSYSPEKSKKRSFDTGSSEESSVESPKKTQKTAQRLSPAKSGLSPDVKILTLKSTPRPPSLIKRSLNTEFDNLTEAFFDSTEEPMDSEFFTEKSTHNLFTNLVASCKEGLQHSLDNSLPMNKRVLFLPKRPDPYSSSGSYITYVRNQVPALIVKPANQEAGARDCPTGKPAERSGINPGESVIRERIARKVQELLGVDLGIPPVCMTTMQHPFFGAIKEVQECLNQLKMKGIDLSLKDLFETAPETYDTTAIAQKLIAKVQEPTLREIRKAGMTEEESSRFVAFCTEQCNEKDIVKFKENLSRTFHQAQWTSKAGPRVIQFWGIVEKQMGIEDLIQKTYDLFRENARNNPEAFVSAQQFEENYCSLLDLSKEECKKIPIKEFHKLIIDIILLNDDRHLANILVRKASDAYEFILIDHGYCLPRPQYSEDCSGLKEARYEFLPFDQANHPITDRIEEVISDLNIKSFIKNLKTEMAAEKNDHPKYTHLCDIPDECYLLIDFNLHLLKKGVELNRTLKEIASFQAPQQIKPPRKEFRGKNATTKTDEETPSPPKHFGGEIVATFKEVVAPDFSGKLTIDYKLLDQRLDQIFSSDRVYEDTI